MYEYNPPHSSIINQSACQSFSLKHESFEDPSFAFDWDHAFAPPLLQKIRKLLPIDQLSPNNLSDFQKCICLTSFVHHLWEHNGTNNPGIKNPLEIIERALGGERFRCVEFSIVLAACLQSLDLPARVTYLKMENVETIPSGAGHVVVEAYIDEKWIMLDPQANMIPVANNIPLNALELSNHLHNAGRRGISSAVDSLSWQSEEELEDYLSFIQQYLFYFDTSLSPSENSNQRVMLVPIGAKKPTVFQITSPLDNFLYTNSHTSFYQRPDC